MSEKRQMPDEISAINRIGRILEALEDDERRRVLTWMVDKFGTPTSSTWSLTNTGSEGKPFTMTRMTSEEAAAELKRRPVGETP